MLRVIFWFYFNASDYFVLCVGKNGYIVNCLLNAYLYFFHVFFLKRFMEDPYVGFNITF